MKANETKDMIHPQAATRWTEAFLGTQKPWPNADNYNQAIMAPESWWENLQVQEVLIVGGRDEILVDSIEVFGRTLKKALGEERVTVLIAEGEAHDVTNMDLQLGYAEPGEQARLVRKWVASKL